MYYLQNLIFVIDYSIKKNYSHSQGINLFWPK